MDNQYLELPNGLDETVFSLSNIVFIAKENLSEGKGRFRILVRYPASMCENILKLVYDKEYDRDADYKMIGKKLINKGNCVVNQ